ncbi:MAG: YcjX family protein [Pseudomonadota bacterium]
MKFTTLTDEARIALGGLYDYAGDVVNPTIRLGVTGLSRAGKTVFITSLVHNLLHGGKLPLFQPYASGQIKRAFLQPQPDDDVPRFAYENHLDALNAGEKRHWPQSTSRISQLRLTLEYEPDGFLSKAISPGTLNIDIVDYPGEWLLDLGLLDMSYTEWSKRTIMAAQTAPRNQVSKSWLTHLKTIDPKGQAIEQVAQTASEQFKTYLQACRDDTLAQSTLPPGRFLMPGDLDGSPLLTFAPLDLGDEETPQSGSLTEMMERRYNSYVNKVVKPFYIDHFSRLDRQIVLVDLLSALNAGPQAVDDVRNALSDILASFRPGQNSWLKAILGKRIDRIVFAATKADQLHHTSHDRLEAILRQVVGEALQRTESSGAQHDCVALASIRATREHILKQAGEELPAIVGVPKEGERLDGKVYDGKEEIALFPGDLPENPRDALRQDSDPTEAVFLRFRPPNRGGATGIDSGGFAHIRLDKTLQFLLGDRLA